MAIDLGIDGIGPAEELGRGGSAQVFRARQASLDREVAVKLLSNTDEDFARRFEREAKTLGRLSRHSGIVTLYEHGRTADGRPYLVMELCEGSLHDRVKKDGPLPADEVATIVGSIAASLDAAHDADVVHRDLKPANILVSHEGKHLISDFGISTVSGSTSGDTSNVAFTAGYAAPETFTGAQTSGQEADVYGLGATMFHLLRGSAPFATSDREPNLLALIGRIANEPPPDLRPHGVPADICELMESMLAKDPANRIQTAAQVEDWIN